MSKYEDAFEGYFGMLLPHLPAPKPQYPFAAEHVGRSPGVRKRLTDAGLRNWRLDFAWPDAKVAVEIDGGQWKPIRRRDGSVSYGGRHNTPEGFRSDCEKLNAAAVLGWTVLRFTGEMLEEDTPLVFEQVEKLLTERLA